MASVAGERLTDSHRRSVLALRAATLRELLRLWPIFDLADIDGSWRRLSPALLALTQRRHEDAATRGAAFYQAFRRAEQVPGTPTPRLAKFDPRKAEASLTLVGPIWTKTSIARGIQNPLDVAFERVAGEVSRQVLNGDRLTVVESVKADRQALGYRRISDGNPCAFCAMLIGRGAVFTEASVGFKAHRKCGCTARAVYDLNDAPSRRARELQQLWNESTRGHRGRNAIRAFRQAYEGR